jgi:hypothetical protein
MAAASDPVVILSAPRSAASIAAMSHIEGSLTFETECDHARLALSSSPLIVIRNSGKDLS